MAGHSTDPGRSVTSKVTAILMVLADGGVHTLSEIADAAHLPTSTAHRLASELVAWRLLERTEPGRGHGGGVAGVWALVSSAELPHAVTSATATAMAVALRALVTRHMTSPDVLRCSVTKDLPTRR